MWKFHGSIKKEVEIPRVRKKNHVEFLWALVFYLGISKGVPHNSAEFPGVVVSGISEGKVTNLKISGGFSEKYIREYSQPPIQIFSGISHFLASTKKIGTIFVDSDLKCPFIKFSVIIA